MVSNYSFNSELISNKKFTPEEFEKIKTEIESREDFSQIYQIFSEVIEINFNGYIEIYVDSFPFENDISVDIIDMINDIDSLIKGGWSSDSKIEFYSIKPVFSYVWYKDGEDWKESEIKVPKDNFYPCDIDKDFQIDQDEDFYSSSSYSGYDEDEESDW